jgi:AhpD family alkylhydroperoxidase
MTAIQPDSSRLPLVDMPLEPLARELFEKLAAAGGILNLHRMMAHAPALMQASGDMATAFRRETMLERSLAELVVLRTAQVIDCAYVWRRHVPLARDAGATAEQIAGLAAWRESGAFTPAQKAALDFAETAVRGAPVDAATFAALRGDFSPREIVELAMLVGFYVSTAIVIKTLAVPDEDS